MKASNEVELTEVEIDVRVKEAGFDWIVSFTHPKFGLCKFIGTFNDEVFQALEAKMNFRDATKKDAKNLAYVALGIIQRDYENFYFEVINKGVCRGTH